jgi:hypothetical protein
MYSYAEPAVVLPYRFNMQFTARANSSGYRALWEYFPRSILVSHPTLSVTPVTRQKGVFYILQIPTSVFEDGPLSVPVTR